MAGKTVVRKTTKTEAAAPASAPAPVQATPAPVATPTPVVVAPVTPAPAAAVKVTRTVKKAAKAAEPKVEAKADDEVKTESTEAEKKPRRKRPAQRPFEEVCPENEEKLTVAYKNLQEARKLFGQLHSSHKKAVSNSKTHQSVARTPTILFDQDLVDYLLARLDANELVVSRRTSTGKEDVTLASLTPETRLHRTDVTKLFSKVFEKHSMLDSNDRRVIRYQDDSDLVHLLTTGNLDPKYQTDVDAILAGTHRLTIFNIQRVISQHLGKVEAAEATEPAAEEAEEQA